MLQFYNSKLNIQKIRCWASPLHPIILHYFPLWPSCNNVAEPIYLVELPFFPLFFSGQDRTRFPSACRAHLLRHEGFPALYCSLLLAVQLALFFARTWALGCCVHAASPAVSWCLQQVCKTAFVPVLILALLAVILPWRVRGGFFLMASRAFSSRETVPCGVVSPYALSTAAGGICIFLS